jgi:hypothetical protein
MECFKLDQYGALENKMNPKRTSYFIRVVSIFLIILIVNRETSFASPTLERAGVAAYNQTRIDLEIPESVAAIEDVYQNTVRGGEEAAHTLYLIQDAHTNSSGQINVAKTLDLLLKNNNQIKYVFLEAGQGDESLSFLRPYATLKKRKDAADIALRQGLLQGSEYLDLTSDHQFTLWGVEDLRLYERSVDAYGAVVKQRAKMLRYIANIEATVNVLYSRVLNPSLFYFEEKRKKYESGEIPLTDYYSILTDQAKHADLSLGAYPHLQKINGLRVLEEKINFDKATAEQDEALAALSRDIQDELLGLTEQGKTPLKVYGAEFCEARAFYAALDLKLRSLPEGTRSGIEPKKYPNFTLYVDYLKNAADLDLSSVFEEQRALESKLLNVLAMTADERRLVRAAWMLELLKKLFNLTLTPDEWISYQKNKTDEDISRITGFLNKMIKDLAAYYERVLFLEDGYDEAVGQAEEFYQLTFARDERFVAAILDKLSGGDNAPGQSAVLIVGGFHAPHIKELLKAKKINFVSIVPQVPQETDQKRYESILLGQMDRSKAVYLSQNSKMTLPQNTRTNMPLRSPLERTRFVVRELGIREPAVAQVFSGRAYRQAEALFGGDSIRPDEEPARFAGARMADAINPYFVRSFEPRAALEFLASYMKQRGGLPEELKKMSDANPEEGTPEFERCITAYVRLLRGIFNELKRDRYHISTEFLPDDVYNAYSVLARRVYGSKKAISLEVDNHSRRVDGAGYVNVSAFPDGRRGYVIDNYGMPGRWQVSVKTMEYLSDRLILRAVDALEKSKGLNKSNAWVRMQIVDSFPPHIQNLSGSDRGAWGVDDVDGSIIISRALCLMSRDEQAAMFMNGINQLDLMAPAEGDMAGQDVTPPTKAEHPSDSLIASLAMVEAGRGRDYLHWKFNYRLQAFTESMKQDGQDVGFKSIESDADIEEFIRSYQSQKQDIVVFSLYELRAGEIGALYKIIGRIKAIHPNVTVILEGPATMHAKQLLAICPEIDMMVRGESDEVIPFIAGIKEKNSRLTAAQAEEILARFPNGIFLRAGASVYFSNFEKTIVNQQITMTHPVREMSSIWYAEHGCPLKCHYCRLDTGGTQKGRIITADQRIDWMLRRLMLELDESGSMTLEGLRQILLDQASGTDTLRQSPAVSLLADSFIGRGQIEIVNVSENSLISKAIIHDFAKKIRELGLQKYFRIKMADATITSLYSPASGPDLEYIRDLKLAGVYFIGFGTENLSQVILEDLGKGFDARGLGRAPAYTTDAVLAVNKALLQEGFDPTCIRHNMIFNTPDLTLEETKSGVLLYYVAPIYNSVLGYFGNGWGNARNSRMYAVEGALWTTIDNARYAFTWDFSDALAAANQEKEPYFFKDGFFVVTETPEYMLRDEASQLYYFDERVAPFSSIFSHPNFHRNRLVQKVREVVSEEDVARAVLSWKQESQGQEVNALATIMDIYEQGVAGTHLEALFRVKADMVSLGMLTFLDYLAALEQNPDLPRLMNSAHVYEMFSEGEDKMRPGTVDPVEALTMFHRSELMGKIIMAWGLAAPAGADPGPALGNIADVVRGRVPDQSHHKDHGVGALAALANPADAGELIRRCEQAMEVYESQVRNLAETSLIGRMAYPDQQIFEYVQHLYSLEDDKALFDRVVRKMNDRRLGYETAIRELVVERLGSIGESEADDYTMFVKTSKEYENYYLYGNSGLLSRLVHSGARERLSIIQELLTVFSKSSNPYILKTIALALRDLSTQTAVSRQTVVTADPSTVARLRGLVGDLSEEGLVFGSAGSGLVIASTGLSNHGRALLVARQLGPRTVSDPNVYLELVRGEWKAALIDGNTVTLERQEIDADTLQQYSHKMKFEGNEAMLEGHLYQYASLSGRHVKSVTDEMRDFFDDMGNRDYTRFMMSSSEVFLYTLPLIRLMSSNPDAVAFVMARGMEIFHNAGQVLLHEFGLNEQLQRTVYSGLFRQTQIADPRNTLLAQSILPLLKSDEADAPVKADTWDELIAYTQSAGIESPLDDYLMRVWGLAGGLSGMRDDGMSLGQAVKYVANFGLDPRFLEYYERVREAHPADPLLEDHFLQNSSYPYEAVIEEIAGTHRERAQRYLTSENRRGMREGILRLAGDDQRLLTKQRELIHAYARIFGYAEDVRTLKNGMAHGARPLLNILLKNTELAQRVNGRMVFTVDEATISGTALLLGELVMRSFAGGQAKVFTHNMMQRTQASNDYLIEKGVLDSSSGHGIWCQEDVNELYMGMFIESADQGKPFHSFMDLQKYFRDRQVSRYPNLSSDNIDDELTRLNQMIDDYITENNLLDFIDEFPWIKADPHYAKREIFKMLLRMNDPLLEFISQKIIVDDLAKRLTIGETDFPVQFLVKRRVAAFLREYAGVELPSAMVVLDERTRDEDVARYLDRYASKAQHTVEDYFDIGRGMSSGQMKSSIERYLAGLETFESVREQFYKGKAAADHRTLYKSKEIVCDRDGRGLFIYYVYDDGLFRLEPLSGPGLAQAQASQNKNIRLAAKDSVDRIQKNTALLRNFLEAQARIGVESSGVMRQTVQSVIDKYESIVAGADSTGARLSREPSSRIALFLSNLDRVSPKFLGARLALADTGSNRVSVYQLESKGAGLLMATVHDKKYTINTNVSAANTSTRVRRANGQQTTANINDISSRILNENRLKHSASVSGQPAAIFVHVNGLGRGNLLRARISNLCVNFGRLNPGSGVVFVGDEKTVEIAIDEARRSGMNLNISFTRTLPRRLLKISQSHLVVQGKLTDTIIKGYPSDSRWLAIEQDDYAGYNVFAFGPQASMLQSIALAKTDEDLFEAYHLFLQMEPSYNPSTDNSRGLSFDQFKKMISGDRGLLNAFPARSKYSGKLNDVIRVYVLARESDRSV